jgi:hypothetical protein
MPFNLLQQFLELMNPIRTAITPKRVMNIEMLASEIHQMMNHKSNNFARDQKPKTPMFESENIEIRGHTTNARLNDQTHKVWIKANRRTVERAHQEKN